MNSAAFLDSWTGKLRAAGIGTARLDILVLLEDCVRRSRAQILAQPELRLAEEQIAKMEAWLARRLQHEPLAYIRGHCEFYGRKFYIDKRVLQPRPESETMIDLLKTLRLPISPRISDVGTGSGALGITVVLEIPRATADLFEIDKAALKVAAKNVKKHGLSIACIESDLLRAGRGSYDVILANLPYVPATHYVNEAAGHEPRLAIYGGGDGLEIYRRLFNQLASHHSPPQFVLTESLPPQHHRLADIASSAGYQRQTHQDFIQVFEQV